MISCRTFVLAFTSIASAMSAAAAPTTCARELAVTEISLIKTAIRLQAAANVSQGEKCAAYRTNAEVVTRAREVFDRCSTGRSREQDLGQMDGVLSQVKSVLANSCAIQ